MTVEHRPQYKEICGRLECDTIQYDMIRYDMIILVQMRCHVYDLSSSPEVGLNVGGQCVAVNVRNARQFKSKSNVPFSVALENVEEGTVAANPIVK